MKNFKDKIVVITGGGSGIGRALAIAFGRKGAKLALNDFNKQGLDKTIAILKGENINHVLSSVFDVSNKVLMDDFAISVKSEWGNAHIIINNAGISGESEPAYLMSEESYRRTMDVNFFGVLNGCQSFLPQLVANNEGAVVNISSIFGLVGTPNTSAYCASKFAVRGYTESLAVEFHESPIMILCVHPGGIKTNIAGDASKTEFAEKYLTTPPEDLANRIIKGIQNKEVKIVFGRDSFKTWIGSNLVPQKLLNSLIWKELSKMLDMEQYKAFIKNV